MGKDSHTHIHALPMLHTAKELRFLTAVRDLLRSGFTPTKITVAFHALPVHSYLSQLINVGQIISFFHAATMGVLVTLSDNFKLCLAASVPLVLVICLCSQFISLLLTLRASRSSRSLWEYLFSTHLPHTQGPFLHDAQTCMPGTMHGRGLSIWICTDVTRNMVKNYPSQPFIALCDTHTITHRPNSKIWPITATDWHAYRSSRFVATDPSTHAFQKD